MNEMPPTPRMLTIEDVHKLIGALTLELDQLRRENAALRAQLAQLTQPAEALDGSGRG